MKRPSNLLAPWLVLLLASGHRAPVVLAQQRQPAPPGASGDGDDGTFANPVIWQDHPDLDVFRVGSVFYYSSSTFAYSPGAPVLKSYDLVHWEAVSHSVPVLNFGSKYDLTPGSQAYVKGIWASTLRYRPSTDTFHWMGCIESGRTYVWTSTDSQASKNSGEVTRWNWTSHEPPINTCYYDCGLLVDDDPQETLYVAYGNTRISVAQLSPDGLRQVRTQEVYASRSGTIEGSRMYKIRGTYYIFVTRPADAEIVLKSTTSSPFGPYEARTLVSRISGPLANAGYAHQGGIVDTPDGKWYYVAFMDAYPGGRIPVVAPLTWSADGWPSLVTDSRGGWGVRYPVPVVLTGSNRTLTPLSSVLGVPHTDKFDGADLGHEWEWNHNPDRSKFRLDSKNGGGLVLQTATVTNDLFLARNTLTRRITGPKSRGTFRIDVSRMRDGDRAGAVLFRDRAAYIGVWKNANGTSTILMVTNLTLTEGTWRTAATGTVAAAGTVVDTSGGQGVEVWLRIDADITPAFSGGQTRTATFSYSLDGTNFVRLGPAFPMSNSWRYFTGYRFGVFNHATRELGGEITVKSFQTELLS